MQSRILALIALLALLTGAFAGVALADGDTTIICHVATHDSTTAHTIIVTNNVLDAHLAHGDTLGSCPGPNMAGEDVLYTEARGVVQFYNPAAGTFMIDDRFFILNQSLGFTLADGQQVIVRGTPLDDGRILVLSISQDATLQDAEYDVVNDVIPAILLDVTGMVTAYDPATGMLTLDNQIIVLLVAPPGFDLQTGMLVTVSGELLLDGRILADMIALYDSNVEVEVPADGAVGTICHIPPGNPANAHTITVGGSAIPAHLGHGDTLGPCEGDATGVVTTCGDGDCDALTVILVDSFDVDFEEVEALRANGYGVGEIARVYLLASEADVEPQEIIDLRNSGLGWGQIMQTYPGVHPSELAPGILIGNGRGQSLRSDDDGLPGRGRGRGNGNANGNGNGRGNGNANGNGNGRGNGNANGNANGNGNGRGNGNANGNGNGRGN